MVRVVLLSSLALGADLLVGIGQPYTTIDDALDDADDGDRILVDPGTYVEGHLTLDELQVTIEGAGPGVVIQSTASSRVFTLYEEAELTLVHVTVDAQNARGGFRLDEDNVLELRQVTLQNLYTTGRGAGIDASKATLIIEGSVLDGAHADGANGGHVYASESDVTVRDSTFRAGQADAGGALYLVDAEALIERSSFEGNVAVDDGSAIYATGKDVVVLDAGFTGNTAGDEGTISCRFMGSCWLERTYFDGNNAGTGAMVHTREAGKLEVWSSTVCRSSGAATLIEADKTELFMKGTAFTAFDVSASAVRLDLDSPATLHNNTLVLGDGPEGIIEGDGDIELVNNLVAFHTTSVDPAVVGRKGFDGGYNLYFDNSGGDVSPGPFGSDIQGVDPMIGSPALGSCDIDELRPLKGSPLVDAGDPSLSDPDGSRSDIGAFGGESANPGVEPDEPLPDIDGDGDGYPASLDCDDADSAVNPGALEIGCNGIDDDCDPATPDGDTTDGDGDGVSACDGDCNDADAAVSPTLLEVGCNGVDDDCDPATPDGDTTDADGDGVSACDDDCNDANPDVSPYALEVGCNGIDDDCDPTTPDGDATDGDGDGVSACDGDCDDTNASVAPGLSELGCNGVDDDCDPTTLDGVDADGDGVPVCTDCDDNDPEGAELLLVYADFDQDGYGEGQPAEFCVPPASTALLDGDCDNHDPTVYPGAPEVLDDGIDQDCDGADLTDLDGDGVSAADGDCDDNDPTRHPGALDVPEDGIDQDCTGYDVEATLVGASAWSCSCSAGPSGGGAPWLLLLGGLVVRRRAG